MGRKLDCSAANNCRLCELVCVEWPKKIKWKPTPTKRSFTFSRTERRVYAHNGAHNNNNNNQSQRNRKKWTHEFHCSGDKENGREREENTRFIRCPLCLHFWSIFIPFTIYISTDWLAWYWVEWHRFVHGVVYVPQIHNRFNRSCANSDRSIDLSSNLNSFETAIFAHTHIHTCTIHVPMDETCVEKSYLIDHSQLSIFIALRTLTPSLVWECEYRKSKWPQHDTRLCLNSKWCFRIPNGLVFNHIRHTRTHTAAQSMDRRPYAMYIPSIYSYSARTMYDYLFRCIIFIAFNW